MTVYDREFPKGLHIFSQLRLNNGCHQFHNISGSAKNLEEKKWWLIIAFPGSALNR